jgi:uncharacterized small protein (DUF1192 family)
MRPGRVNVVSMDLEDIFAKTPDDPLARLCRQDLDPLSVEELERRIALLEGEIARSRARIAASTHHRSAADALFRR